jgi:hypothetical protein
MSYGFFSTLFITGISIARIENKIQGKGACNAAINLPVEERKSHEGKSNTKENPAAARRFRTVSGNGSIYSENQSVP